MNRVDAEKVFKLVAELHGDLHDRLVPDRWWLVWTLMGVEILITNSLTQFLINRGIVRPTVHFGIFTTQVLALAATIRIAQRNSGGARSQSEMFVWWIWTTFLLAASVSVGLNLLLHLPMFNLAAMLPLLAAVAFSMMGMVIDPLFTIAAALFVVTSLAMARLPSLQFYLYGGAWFIALEAFGYLHRPRAQLSGRAL